MTVTLDELGQFLREPPPRAIPINVLRRRLRGLLGRTPMVVGLMVFVLSGVPAGLFFPWRLIGEIRLDGAGVQTAQGRVISSEKTSISVGKGKHQRGSPVWRIEFEYPHPHAGRVQGACFMVGAGEPPGKTVQVEFIDSAPSTCRIDGSRLNPVGYLGLLVGLLPLGSMGLVYWSWRARRRARDLLRDGVFGLGEVTDVRATNVKVNNQVRHRVSVLVEVDGQPFTTSCHAYGAEAELAAAHMHNKEKVGVLYDRSQPRRLLLAETLLGGQ